MIREFWDKNWREAVRWQQNTGVPGRVWQWDNDGDVSQVFSSNSEWFSISDQGWLVEERRQRWRVRRECTHCTVQCTWSVQASVSCVVSQSDATMLVMDTELEPGSSPQSKHSSSHQRHSSLSSSLSSVLTSSLVTLLVICSLPQLCSSHQCSHHYPRDHQVRNYLHCLQQ